MKILIAKTAGFCMGVKRAVEMALSTARDSTENEIYTLGPLIHNDQVVNDLAANGIKKTDTIPDSGTVIIRAHGVPPEINTELIAKDIQIVDATCPHVISSQRIIKKAAKDGKDIVIAGDKNHPEVISLAGQASTSVYIVSNMEEARALDLDDEFILIAQTTFSRDLYREIEVILNDKYSSCTSFDSICDATEMRQEEAKAIAEQCEVLVVVGGKNSANTCRLAEIGKLAGRVVYHIETVAELNQDDFVGIGSVGITAGASTPQSAIIEVAKFIESISNA